MMEQAPHRIRIKLPDGSELEAEGTADFVEKQRKEFLEHRPIMPAPQALAAADHGPAGAPQISWDTIAQAAGHRIQLRSKLTGKTQEKDACLALLAASENLLNMPRPTAALLAKWLRASGYPVTRVDRAIHHAISQGEIIASGSRRARRYELTAPGRLKAYLLAEQLTRLISGPPRPHPETHQGRH
ncbi:MAG: hypothetical protein HY927_12405 [Elusimicrobia bacterium]|nr:hypothetical protein [Elusimicrobiota bacterium]